jgi:DNA transposition AAA+ family ATPase
MEKALTLLPPLAPVESSAESDGQGAKGRRYRIPGDVVNQGTANLPEAQRHELRWLNHHLYTNDIPIGEVAVKLKKENGEPYSVDSIYQALTGRRGADSAKICAAIERYREYVEREQKTIKTGFIETSLSARIWDACARALRRHRIVFIFGDFQIGKTEALKEYARRHNHGQTVYVRMPTAGSLALFMVNLCDALSIPRNLSIQVLRPRIISAFDPSMLLIVDECHQATRNLSRVNSVHSIEFAREIIDVSGCGGVLCGSNEFHHDIKKGRTAHILRQTWLRQLSPVFLPNVPSDTDLTTFAKAFGLGSAAPRKTIKVTTTDPNSGDAIEIQKNPYDLQTEVARVDGLGRWIAMLQEAADMAVDQGRPLNWGHVLLAHDSFTRMEHGAS